VPYGTPGTPDLGERLEPFVTEHDGLLMANHGAVTMGATLDEAQMRMERLEPSATISLAARLLGRMAPWSPDQVASLGAPRAGARERA
jgi:L-fuculose-phosphate aldolase